LIDCVGCKAPKIGSFVVTTKPDHGFDRRKKKMGCGGVYKGTIRR